MSTPGIGAMLHQLSGGSAHNPDEFYGRKIVAASIDKSIPDDDFWAEHDRLTLTFEDGVTIDLWDNGQSCCESRYITCDDNPEDLIGQTLASIEVKDASESEDDYEVHERVFIEVRTDRDFITLCTHNEHNGYYGGFGLTITTRQLNASKEEG